MATRLTRTTAAAILLALAAAIGVYPLIARPDIARTGAFLFSDEGHNLLVAAMLNHGGRIFQDIYTPYGPATAWLWAATARAAGNTPMVFGVLAGALNVAAVMLIFSALCRYTTAGWSLLFTAIAIVPTIMVRGVILGGYWPSPYIPVERVLIAAVLVAWRAPRDRRWARSLMIGVAIGALQWFKFGTAVMVMGGVLAAEGIAMLASTDRRGGWRQIAALVGAAAVVEGVLAVWAVMTLPWPMAKDVLWPAFLSAQYTFAEGALRWPPFAPAMYLFRRDAALVAGAVLGVVVLWRHRRAPVAPLLALLVAAVAIGTPLLFRSVYHCYQYAWLLATAAAFAATSLSPRARIATLIWCAPVLFVQLHYLTATPAPGEWIDTPSAGRLYISAEQANDLRVLNAAEAEVSARGQRLFAGPHMSGWQAAFDHPTWSRHTWFLKGYIRPWEEAGFTESLSGVGAVVVCGERASVHTLWLPPALDAVVSHDFSRDVSSSGTCHVFRRPETTP